MRSPARSQRRIPRHCGLCAAVALGSAAAAGAGSRVERRPRNMTEALEPEHEPEPARREAHGGLCASPANDRRSGVNLRMMPFGLMLASDAPLSDREGVRRRRRAKRL